MLPKDHPNILTLSRDELRSAIERVAQFADERSRAIRLHMGGRGNESTLVGIRDRRKRRDHQRGVLGSGDGYRFNAQYMLDFLRATPEGNVSFHFRDAQSAGELRPSGGDGTGRHRYVIMPMRI